MEIKFLIENNVLQLFFYGELDEHYAQSAREKLDILIDKQNFESVIFDLTDLSFADSTGIGLLIGRYKKLNSRSIKSYIRNPSVQVDKVLSMTGIFKIMPKVG